MGRKLKLNVRKRLPGREAVKKAGMVGLFLGAAGVVSAVFANVFGIILVASSLKLFAGLLVAAWAGIFMMIKFAFDWLRAALFPKRSSSAITLQSSKIPGIAAPRSSDQ